MSDEVLVERRGAVQITAVRHQLTIDPDVAFLLPVEETQQIKQRRLAAA